MNYILYHFLYSQGATKVIHDNNLIISDILELENVSIEMHELVKNGCESNPHGCCIIKF